MSSVLFIIHDLYQDDNPFPLNIAYLSAVLRKEGVHVEIFDMAINHWSNDQLKEHLQHNEYDLIGISFLAARYRETVLPLCKLVNKYKKNAWLVLGGHAASATPEFIREETKADVIVHGEAENVIMDFVEKLFTKGIYRSKFEKDLDSIPFPDWDLFQTAQYSQCLKFPGMIENDKALAILTSRGCINRCNFCQRLEKGIRFRSIDNVLDEMEILHDRYGITYFKMYDEMFGYPKKRVFEFRDKLKERNMDIKYICAARVDSMDKEVVQALKESGCKFLNFGVESANQEVLDLMDKNTTVEENIIAIELAKEAGIYIGINMLWNNLGDNEYTLRQDINFIKKYTDYSQLRTIKPVTPYPGSKLYEIAIEKGLLEGPKDFYDRFQNVDLITVNFMKMSINRAYYMLYRANEELIMDYYKYKPKEGEQILSNLFGLYLNKEQFRGVRHYKS